MPRRTGSAQPHTGASLHTPDGGARSALRPAAGRRLSLLAVVLVLSLGPSLVTAANPVPSWTIIGAKQISKAAASWTSVAVDVNNAPCVAYSDSLTNLTVRRYFGPDAGWRNLGPSSIHPGTSTYLSLAQAPGGVNHVAYRGNSGKITVLKYNFQKNIWTELGPPRFSPGGASFISLAFDSKGTAFVIYSDEALGKRATVQKFDGTKWVLVGPRGLSAGAATDTRIAIGPNDVPVIAYADATKGGRATVRKLSGASWALMGPMGFTTNKVSSIVLRINSLNRPVIGYIDYAPASPTKPKATASRWTGTAWTKLPTAGTVATASLPRNAVSLSLDSAGVPYLVFSDGATGVNGKFTMKKYTSGIAWTPVGKSGPIGGYARYLDVAVDNDDAPVVVFSDAAALNKTTVASWKNPLMSFMALGDWGRGGNAPQKATAALMAGAAGRGMIPEFIISTGDNFYPSGLTSANDPQFASSFKNVYSAPALKNIQWELVLGNHDNCDGAVGCPNCKNSPSFQLSDNIGKLDPRFRAHRTSFLEDLGGGKIAIFFIDTSPFIKQYRTTSWSKCPGGIQTQNNAANLALLDSLLANSFATWKIVIGHHPPNSNGDHGNNPDIIAAIEPILTKHKVQAYFAGHDHNLEHLRKKVTSTYTYDTIVTGGGSSLSGGPKGTANSLKFLPANGFAWASFFDDELLVDFYTVQGGNSSSPTYTARIPRKP